MVLAFVWWIQEDEGNGGWGGMFRAVWTVFGPSAGPSADIRSITHKVSLPLLQNCESGGFLPPITAPLGVVHESTWYEHRDLAQACESSKQRMRKL